MRAVTNPSDSTDRMLSEVEMNHMQPEGVSRRVNGDGGPPRSPPAHEESYASTATTVAGIARSNTSMLEEGLQNTHRNSDYSEKEKLAHIGILGQLKAAIFNSWINVLLVFVPIGIATHYAGVNP